MGRPVTPLLGWLGVGLALAGVIAFIVATPGGLLREFDFIGAAVCHRRPSHSFTVAGHQLPLCQRCTGTFPGALTGVLVHWGLWRRRRASRFPQWPLLIPIIVIAAAWGLDGINSTTSDSHIFDLTQRIWNRPPGIGVLGYAPRPELRLVSGALMGMSMSVVLVPAFNQSLWSDAEESPALRSWHELALLVVIELAMAGLIFVLESSPSALVLYGISIYSVLGVLAMFTLLGAMMFVLVLQRDGSVAGWRDAWSPLAWGVVFAIFVVAVMVSVRLWLTGTVDGVPGLP